MKTIFRSMLMKAGKINEELLNLPELGPSSNCVETDRLGLIKANRDEGREEGISFHHNCNPYSQFYTVLSTDAGSIRNTDSDRVQFIFWISRECRGGWMKCVLTLRLICKLQKTQSK